MDANNKDDNVFRYIHFRGARTENKDVPPIEIIEGGTTGARTPVSSPRINHRSESFIRAKRELESLSPGRHLVLPDGKNASPLAMTQAGYQRLSGNTIALLEKVDPGVEIVGSIVTDLIESLLTIGNLSELVVEDDSSSSASNPLPRPFIRSVGVGELLVVKQNIKCYEAGEIAHIENVAQGEAKIRTHRRLDRREEEEVLESERTIERETELEITDRFELNKESSKTIQKDQQRGFGLSLSGKYGPTVEFSSNLNFQSDTSQTESTSNSITYAKDIVERTRESIVDQVRSLKRTTILREVEEINEHRLENSSDSHINGIYQYVDKLYESQVFNYGLRQLFDFMIPEPASYLWHLERSPNPDVELPVPPIRLDADASDASDINESNYLALAARYEAESLTAPPPRFLTRRSAITHGAGSESEEGKPRSFGETDIEIPSGYTPLFAEISTVLTSDETPTLIVSVGHKMIVLKKSDMVEINLSQGNFKAYTVDSLFASFPAELGDQIGDEKIRVHVFGNETANYTVKVKVTFQRKEVALRDWKLKTYDKIAEAYRNQLIQYQQEVEEVRAKVEQQSDVFETYGSPPAKNLRLIKNELKKHCLTLFRGTHNNDTSTSHTAGNGIENPPQFSISESLSDGAVIRFLENAFEWDQIQYVFYPYYWARTEEWADRFHIKNMDPYLEEFLRAGSARVVIAVTPGFEAAVAHYLQTDEVWLGEGEPDVKDPQYKSIVEEIRERTASGNEVPVGEPWEVRLPTTAVLLRQDTSLPKWERLPDTDWEWRPSN